MENNKAHAVTGAFGYSGKYIAQRLLDSGKTVITLTNSPDRDHSFGKAIAAFPFNFDNPEKLTESLKSVKVLYNTYWVRFNHKTFTHSEAVKNTLTLFDSAKKAGVERIVHISITNPSETSPFEYFRDKAILEKALISSGISYSILRPAVIFGKEDILINNMAWFLRKFPVFGIPGDGNYKLQPIYVEDLATLAITEGLHRNNGIINAIGPETYSYRDLVSMIGSLIGYDRRLLSLPPWIVYLSGILAGMITNDVIITKEELSGLMAGTLCTETQPVGKTKLSEWIKQHSSTLGYNYSSELARRRDRKSAYASD